MINSAYTILFSLRVFHSYFKNNICNCLKFIADAPTSSLLKRYGFKINPTVNGFDFYTSPDDISNTLSYITTATGLNKFSFDIFSVNPGFIGFTNLPANWLGQILYNSQNSENKQQAAEVTLQATLKNEPNANAIGNVTFYFSDFPDSNVPVQFKINLDARCTQWNYYVINQSNIALNNLVIKGKPQVAFTGPENTTIAGGQKALLFSSGSTLLALSETPANIFNLVSGISSGVPENSKHNDKILFKGLPNPDPEKIQFLPDNSQTTAISSMYVYV